MNLLTRTLTLAFCIGTLCCAAPPVISAVVNAASFSGNLAPGCWASVFGSNLADATVAAKAVPLPTQISGVTVKVNDIAAPLLFVSPTQINVLVPFEINVTSTLLVRVVVTTSGGTSVAFPVRLARNAPAVFTIDSTGQGKAIVFDASFQLTTTVGTGPLIFYAAGLGPTDPVASSAAGGASAEPFNRVKDSLEVYIGDKKANILFAGLAPGFPGIYQVNVQPNGASSDRIFLRVGGWQSNVTEVGVTQGANVANVTGSIDPLVPGPGSAAQAFSVMLLAASFKVSFDILPSAKPFDVVAASEAGSAVITVDPTKNHFDGTLTVPAAMARMGDFSSSEFAPILDFITCAANGACISFPGNVLPTPRIPTEWTSAVSLLPMASSGGTNANASAAVSGDFSGTKVTIDQTTNSTASRFGGFMQISRAGAKTRTTTFRLYVDGKLIATKDVTYTVF